MRITGLDHKALLAMEQALRAGEPVVLDLAEPPPRGVRLDELVPLCHSVRTWNPALDRSLRHLLPPAARPGISCQVTAIIPTHRQAPLGLDVLRSQDVEVEVLVLANGRAASGSAAPGLRLQGDRVEYVPWLGHGATRQAGVSLARGEYVFFTVDDAIPMGAGFIRSLVEALENGPWDAVYARQLPWPTADPVTRQRLRAWTPPGRRVVPARHLDNVAALYRRSTLLNNPLPPVPIAEDLRWARGHRIAYVPCAPVLHSHPRRPLSLYRRTVAIHKEHLAMGETPRVPSLPSLLRSLPGTALPALDAGPLELLNQWAELLGQWMAARQSRSPS